MKEQILQNLPAGVLPADRLHWFETIDSTNLEARRLAERGAPHGTVVIADHQTGGKGRMGRSFLSPAGMGIYMSVLLRPQCRPQELMHLTCAAAVAMCDAVENACGLRPGIKWTNDLVWGSRKLAGILTELSIDSKTGFADFAILGIGINCSQIPSDFDPSIRDLAGSLAMCTGGEIDRALLAARMIAALLEMDLSCREPVIARYRRDCITVGKEISLLRPDGSVSHGAAVNVDEYGALLVSFPDGSLEAVNSGEISIRGMYGYV